VASTPQVCPELAPIIAAATVKTDSYLFQEQVLSWAGMKSIIILILIVLSAGTVEAQKVKVGFDPGTDFSKYRTYAWDQGLLPNPIIGQTIKTAVDNALTAKGLQKVEADPDLIVAALVSTESDLTMTNPSWMPVLNSIATGIPASNQQWPVTKGTLVIDISDATTKNGVWRGTATHTLENGPTGDRTRDAKTVEKPITKAVQKMFKQFPPASKN
jgi:Domain of unknown function (DUF4136)